LPIEYLNLSEQAAIIAILLSLIGILLNTFIIAIFIRYANTCVVKATTRELSFIILIGTFLCYLLTIPMLLKPSIYSCYLSRFLPGFSLSLVYGALLTKTNRISRLLTRSKKRIFTNKLRFMSLKAQIVITALITLTECVLIVFSITWNSRVTVTSYKGNLPREHCYLSTSVVNFPLLFDLILVMLCTFYAIRTRNLPENFNEAKFIGLSMYATCIIWIAFLFVYFGSEYKIITLCICTSLSSTVILFTLFLPKVYIILFETERNQRCAFVTSKDLRIHFGSSPNSEVKNDGISRSVENESENSLQNQNKSCQTSREYLLELKKKDKTLPKMKLKRSTSYNSFFHSLNTTASYSKHTSFNLTTDNSFLTLNDSNDNTRPKFLSSLTLNQTDILTDFMSKFGKEDVDFEIP
jgi:hypothetical protein